MPKFLTESGDTHGPVIARAIVDDLLATLERCSPERVPPKTIVWLAVCLERRGQRTGLAPGDWLPVQLTVVTEKEVKLLTDPQLGNARARQVRPAFHRARFGRWCHEAYQQGGVLSHLDLSLLSGWSEGSSGTRLRAYQAETGEIVPTRGTVHDIGPAVTHQAEVVRRWLRHDSPAQIARALNHSQDAVDRYLADYHKGRTLAQTFPPAELPILAGLTPSVVQHYLELLRQYEPTLAVCEPAPAVPF